MKEFYIHVRIDDEMAAVIASLEKALSERDGLKVTRSDAVRRAVVYMERMMRPSEEQKEKGNE